MATFIYVPFPGWEDDAGIVKQVNHNKHKYGLDNVLTGGNAKEEPLGDVQPGDLLIIVGHGLQSNREENDVSNVEGMVANRREVTFIKSNGQEVR